MPLPPAAAGYRMPAEWEPHQATWLSWPHKEASWPGRLHVILPVYAQMVAALARSETVHINVNDAAMEAQARALLKEAGTVGDICFHHFPTNDAWCRDHGAIFVRRTRRDSDETGTGCRLRPDNAAFDRLTRVPVPVSSEPLQEGEAESAHDNGPLLAATDWGFNAWGGKYPPYDLDDQIPAQMAEALGVPRFGGGMILEGGSIDVNGAGLLLTTEACLLNPNRNPHLGREEIQRRLCEMLGVEQVHWLGDGIVGDDTDGHVDDLSRFVAADTVLTAVEEDPADENYAVLQENLERLRSIRDQQGRPLRIELLPMPPAVVYDGQRLPASYANFYVANRVVLLPSYDHPNDFRAQEIVQAFFPDREVVGIDCTDLVWGLGAFHCLTQQVPAE